MRLAVLVMLLAVVILSGCTIPGTGIVLPFPDMGGVVGGSGVIIKSFVPAFSTVRSGEELDFMLTMQNVGTVKAGNVQVMLLGLDTWGMGAKDEATFCTWVDGIDAANTKINSPGETVNCEISRKAPDVPIGLTTTFSPKIRVNYAYRTDLVKSITFASIQELKSMKVRGVSPPMSTTSQTNGPIRFDIKSGPPIKVSDSSAEFPLTITVTNVGGGVVYIDNSFGQSMFNDNKNVGENKINLVVTGGTNLDVGDCDGKEVELWQGKSNTIICDATFNPSRERDFGIQERTLTLTASYSYQIDKVTSISVTN